MIALFTTCNLRSSFFILRSHRQVTHRQQSVELKTQNIQTFAKLYGSRRSSDFFQARREVLVCQKSIFSIFV